MRARRGGRLAGAAGHGRQDDDRVALGHAGVQAVEDPDCPICSRPPEDISDEEMGVFPDYEAFCAAAG